MYKATFALRNFSGKPIQHVAVSTENLSNQETAAVQQPTHHIVIIDRSGSMYGDLPDTKAMVEKLLTLGEFNDPLQRISLISYSSMGDVKCHFAKVTVGDVLKADSPYLKEVRGIQVTGLTCISQSLVLANSLVDDNEITCVTLHSDGYANDRSPSAEKSAIGSAVETLASHPFVFVNTIAYRDWSDFTLLSSVANMGSGVCTQAKTIRQVYDALHSAQKMLSGSMAPALTVSRASDNYLVFYSQSAGKVLGSSKDLTVRGLNSSDDKTAYRYEFIDATAAGALPDADPKAALAYARAQISEGNINAAKYALCGVRSDLLPKHYRALVATEVAAMAADIEQVLFSGTVGQTATVGLPSGPSVLDVLATLGKFKGLRVNTKSLTANYKRQGVKRIGGTRNADGTVTPPEFELKATDGPYADVLSFDLNRNTATINLLTSRKASLVRCATGEVVSEVAGVDTTNLKDYRNFTVVGDGAICTPILPLRISDKRCHKALVDLGAVSGDFDPNADVEVHLGGMPLIGFDQSFSLAGDVFDKLAKMTAAQKILSACVKEASDAFTAEQIAELKAHYLSTSLYFSGPTTTHYADLTEALNKGEVDTRLSYKIDLGNAEITSLGKLPSANAFLDRRFTLTVAGTPFDKPKMTSVLDTDAAWGEKVLGPRIKLTKVDDLLFPIFKSFLLDGGKGEFETILRNAGVDDETVNALLTAMADKAADKVEPILNASRRLGEAIEALYVTTISPLVFYIGATGLVPDDLDAKAHTADQIVAVHPEIALSKDEKEGLFYALPNGLLLTVFVKGEHFTTDAGLAALAA